MAYIGMADIVMAYSCGLCGCGLYSYGLVPTSCATSHTFTLSTLALGGGRNVRNASGVLSKKCLYADPSRLLRVPPQRFFRRGKLIVGSVPTKMLLRGSLGSFRGCSVASCACTCRAALRCCGALQCLARRYDVNGDGAVSYGEFVAAMG